MSQNRPKIICHMMSSIDGKISYGSVNGKDPGIVTFGNFMDLYNRLHDEYKAKSWMVGRSTMQEFTSESGTPLENYDTSNLENDFIFKNDTNNYAIGTDAKGVLRWDKNIIELGNQNLTDDTYNIITIVTESTPKEYLAYLKQLNISYITAGDSDIDFEIALEKLKSLFGIESILLEGGGGINGSIISQNLIDEISLLIFPFVINNSEAPALFYKELQEAKGVYNFKLKEFKEIETGVLWLKYVR